MFYQASYSLMVNTIGNVWLFWLTSKQKCVCVISIENGKRIVESPATLTLGIPFSNIFPLNFHEILSASKMTHKRHRCFVSTLMFIGLCVCVCVSLSVRAQTYSVSQILFFTLFRLTCVGRIVLDSSNADRNVLWLMSFRIIIMKMWEIIVCCLRKRCGPIRCDNFSFGGYLLAGTTRCAHIWSESVILLRSVAEFRCLWTGKR